MNKKNAILFLMLNAFIAIAFNACHVDPAIKKELPANDIRLIIPQGWPYPNYDFSSNSLTTNGFILGRKLFYDTKLSQDNTISCGSCHQQHAAFSHFNHSLSAGVGGRLGTRNAPALFNLNWQTNFMWDGRVNHFEVQPLTPITSSVEMRENITDVINKLQGDADYRRLFSNAFGTETVTSQLMFKALTQFMGMLVSYNSKYDLYMQGKATFSTSELNGFNLFQLKCASCHSAPLFTNLQYMNFGLDSVFTDPGRGGVTGLAADSGTFKVPSLRNVALSNPYMHDGRFSTLDEVLDHYSTGIVHSSTLSPELLSVTPLTTQQKQDIIAFLNTLTDVVFTHDERFNNPFFQ
jgi:cytochrome c peroxidase